MVVWIKSYHIHHMKFNRPIHHDMNLYRNNAGVFLDCKHKDFQAFGFGKVFGRFAQPRSLSVNLDFPAAQVNIFGQYVAMPLRSFVA